MNVYSINYDLIYSKRKSLGYTLDEMSRRMGLNDKTSYYRRENGIYKFKPEEIPIICNILEIPIENFFVNDVSKIETNN